MSKQPTVGIVMDRLVTDEDFRFRLIAASVETLADTYPRGLDFTPNDVALFGQTNRLLRGILEKLTVPPDVLTTT